ncbi:MAG: DUF1043 family protein [Gammaproteobacteria bacterium]|nr:DUF1043 family protein [Gammaproteobacteria bacterium]
MNIWFAGIGVFGLGMLWGWYVGRATSKSATDAKEMENEMRNMRGELDSYHNNVGKHFEETRELVNNMTKSYVAVIEHMAEGSKALCEESPVPDAPELTVDAVTEDAVASAQDAQLVEEVEQASPAASEEDAVEEQPEAQAADDSDAETATQQAEGDAAEAEPEEKQATEPKTLYEKIGGEAAVSAAVDIFYRKVLADERINQFFDGTDMEAQAAKQKAFLTLAFGGPAEYSGRDMREAHAHLVAEKGLDDSHFDAVMEHLGATLQELNVPADLIGEAAAIAESTRNDVLGRDPIPDDAITPPPVKQEEQRVYH